MNIIPNTEIKKNNEKKFENIKTNSVLQEKLKKIFLFREKQKFEYNKQEIPEQLKYHSDSTSSEPVEDKNKEDINKNNDKKFNIKTNSVLQEKLKKIFLDREKRKFEYNKQEIPESLKYHSDSTSSDKEIEENQKKVKIQ